MKGFRELRVWHQAMNLVQKIYLLTQDFPREEANGLTSQMRRAVVSVPSNIAEGHTRNHLKEYLHHLSISQGSLAELETQVELASRLQYISSGQFNEVLEDVQSLAKQLYALRNSLRRS